MFKAFLRTDGVVTVKGGDIAWQNKRRHFQKLCTIHFASLFMNNKNLKISDLSPSDRTIEMTPWDLLDLDRPEVSQSQYDQARIIIRNVLASETQTSNVIALDKGWALAAD